MIAGNKNMARGDRNMIKGSKNLVNGNSNVVINTLKDLSIFAGEQMH